mgnify:CR=1 FL=1
MSRVVISGEPSEILCTEEEAMEWLECLGEEYDNSLKKLENCRFNLAFLSKSEIQEINKLFAGKDKPTNVLSFPSSDDIGKDNFLGDIAICSELIREESISQGKKINHHLIHIFVHGVLHLLGFDHAEQSSAEQMEALEVRVLKKLGVADPY